MLKLRKKRPIIAHVTEQTIRKTHLKVHRKKARNSLEKSPLNELTRLLLSSIQIIALSINSRNFFFEEVHSPWHSKQASSVHNLAETFLEFFPYTFRCVFLPVFSITQATNSSDFPLFPLFP